jgi:hypothetical protein
MQKVHVANEETLRTNRQRPWLIWILISKPWSWLGGGEGYTPVAARGSAIRSEPDGGLGNGLPDAAGEFSKSIAVLHLYRAWAGQVNNKLGRDPAGAGAHHQCSVRQQGRLPSAVGYH